MRTKAILGVVLAAAMLMCLQTTVFAKNSDGVGNGIGILELYMTADANDFFAQDSFHEDELPWLYMKVKDSVERVTGDWWFWNKGNQDFLLEFDTSDLDPMQWELISSDNTDNTKNLWLRRLDITEYTAHDQWWHINGVKAYGPNGGQHQTKYHVTPEPISSVLFLLGAGTLAYATRRRKS